MRFSAAIEDRSEITGMLVQGFRKCLQTSCKYRSDPERVFSVVLEDDADVLKWFRPSRRDVRIYYTFGSEQPQYKPDIIVQTQSGVMSNVTVEQKQVFLYLAQKYDSDVLEIVNRGLGNEIIIGAEREARTLEVFADHICDWV